MIIMLYRTSPFIPVYSLERPRLFAPVYVRDLGVTGPAAAQKDALGQQSRSGCPVDGAIHAPAAQKRTVGGIDNGVNRQCRDVGLDRPDSAALVRHSSVPSSAGPGTWRRSPPPPSSPAPQALVPSPTGFLFLFRLFLPGFS